MEIFFLDRPMSGAAALVIDRPDATARARAREALRRAEAAELRAQALHERQDASAT